MKTIILRLHCSNKLRAHTRAWLRFSVKKEFNSLACSHCSLNIELEYELNAVKAKPTNKPTNKNQKQVR